MIQTTALLKELEKTHEDMVRLAEQLDWNNLVSVWQTAAPKVAELKEIRFDALPANEKTIACDALQKLLSHQNRVIGRIIPWMEQVRPLLKGMDSHPMNDTPTRPKA